MLDATLLKQIEASVEKISGAHTKLELIKAGVENLKELGIPVELNLAEVETQ